MNDNLQAIILAAGKSTRFNTEKTKLAETICGQAMILFSTKLMATLHIPTTVVVGYQQEIIKKIIFAEHNDTITCAVQEEQNGTGHALACTQELWNNDYILVMNGDMPLVTVTIIKSLYDEHIKSGAAISFVTACITHSQEQSYGRVVVADNCISIIEAKDFIGNLEENYLINAGIYIITKKFLKNYISTLNDNNANKEFYITDLVKIASDNGYIVTTTKASFDDICGINTFEELSTIEQIKRLEIIKHWMKQGVRFSHPHQTHVDTTVIIGQGSYIGTAVQLRGNTIIGKNCTIAEFSSLNNVILENDVTIHSHCVIEDSYIESHADIGPFAHLRSNATIKHKSVIGNFVEIKNSVINTETKIKHLSYIGDATVGSRVNIGAGTITCNYDGITKHTTIINDHAFIGSNNTIVAPVTIGENAFTAAGSTITADVPTNALAIARSHQTNKHNYAQKLKTTSVESIITPENNSDTFSFIGARCIRSTTPADEQ
ncbi:MAG TPA: bifunctional UDP-N-acetylglucosamine diphosphorylase/glucosamine-1-phosphate N-acetyltransferase GlmU [Candidatus Babeliales bacterium]|nr:bifunctional UDP-N-acetylglucosamine diphosphorylase/glucosamine-1-phosphate N-acetyltransferase GlmU [Candidatus Babeliales bacterium]